MPPQKWHPRGQRRLEMLALIGLSCSTCRKSCTQPLAASRLAGTCVREAVRLSRIRLKEWHMVESSLMNPTNEAQHRCTQLVAPALRSHPRAEPVGQAWDPSLFLYHLSAPCSLPPSLALPLSIFPQHLLRRCRLSVCVLSLPISVISHSTPALATSPSFFPYNTNTVIIQNVVLRRAPDLPRPCRNPSVQSVI